MRICVVMANFNRMTPASVETLIKRSLSKGPVNKPAAIWKSFFKLVTRYSFAGLIDRPFDILIKNQLVESPVDPDADRNRRAGLLADPGHVIPKIATADQQRAPKQKPARLSGTAHEDARRLSSRSAPWSSKPLPRRQRLARVRSAGTGCHDPAGGRRRGR